MARHADGADAADLSREEMVTYFNLLGFERCGAAAGWWWGVRTRTFACYKYRDDRVVIALDLSNFRPEDCKWTWESIDIYVLHELFTFVRRIYVQ